MKFFHENFLCRFFRQIVIIAIRTYHTSNLDLKGIEVFVTIPLQNSEKVLLNRLLIGLCQRLFDAQWH